MNDQPRTGASRRDLFKLSAFGLGAGATAAMFPGLASAAPGDGLPVPDTSTGYFLKLGSIEGDSVMQAYPKWIPVLSWDWGVALATSTTSTGGASVGKPKPAPFKFLCFTGKHTPPMFTQMLKGLALTTVKFAVRPAEWSFAPWQIQFEKVLINDYENFPSQNNGAPMDLAQFVYQRITLTYTPQLDTGAAGTPIVSSYDFALGK